MKQNQWFAVRCCCTPKKVFGFIKLPITSDVRLPDYRTIKDAMGDIHPIKLMSIYINRHYRASIMNAQPLEGILEHTMPEIAIYSDNHPIEFWRTIPGFVEAPPTED